MATIMQTQQQQPQKDVRPPLRFPLSIVPVTKALADIKHITGNFKDMDYEYVQTLLSNLMAQSSRWMYESVGYIPAPPSTMPKSLDIIKQVIGKDGCYFKQTTENCGIDLIYYDQEQEVFMFWGPTRVTVTNAMNIIRSRICRTISKVFPRPPIVRIAPVPIETKEYLRFDQFMALNADNEPFNPNETRETIIYDLYEKKDDEGAVDPTDLFARLSALKLDTDSRTPDDVKTNREEEEWFQSRPLRYKGASKYSMKNDDDTFRDQYGVECVSNMDCPCFDCSPCHGACDADCTRPKLN